jgi:tetratricopeptide (TPR) repeat protein
MRAADKIERIFERADALMIEDQNYTKAIPLYQEILTLDPENIDALNSLAQSIKLQKSPSVDIFTVCRDLLEKALSLDPRDYESNFNMAVLLYEFKKDSEQTISFFKTAISIEQNPIALFNLGVIFEER